MWVLEQFIIPPHQKTTSLKRKQWVSGGYLDIFCDKISVRINTYKNREQLKIFFFFFIQDFGSGFIRLMLPETFMKVVIDSQALWVAL